MHTVITTLTAIALAGNLLTMRTITIIAALALVSNLAACGGGADVTPQKEAQDSEAYRMSLWAYEGGTAATYTDAKYCAAFRSSSPAFCAGK